MKIHIQETEDRIYAFIKGPIELATIKIFKEQITDYTNLKERDLYLNLRDVDYIDSTGIGNLIALAKNQRQREKRFRMVEVPHKIMELLELSSLRQYID